MTRHLAEATATHAGVLKRIRDHADYIAAEKERQEALAGSQLPPEEPVQLHVPPPPSAPE